MSDNFKTFVVINPNSANRRTLNEWPLIEQELKRNLGGFGVEFTSGPDEATKITRSALKDGYEMIVCVGGDGTNNEVINGFFEDDKMINPQSVFGMICRGTGSDLRKTVGSPRDIIEAAKVLGGKKIKACDLGKTTFINHQGKETGRYFINIADFGIGGEAVDRVNKTTKIFGGFISFLWATLVTSFIYRNKRVQLRIDDESFKEEFIKNVVVANGKFFGGGMQIAPRAKMDDGVFEIVVLGNLGWVEGFLVMRKIYKGEIIKNKKVRYSSAKRVMATSEQRVLLDLDGEQPGMLPATFEIIPQVIKVKV